MMSPYVCCTLLFFVVGAAGCGCHLLGRPRDRETEITLLISGAIHVAFALWAISVLMRAE